MRTVRTYMDVVFLRERTTIHSDPVPTRGRESGYSPLELRAREEGGDDDGASKHQSTFVVVRSQYFRGLRMFGFSRGHIEHT